VDAAVLATSDPDVTAAVIAANPALVLDLTGSQPAEVEALAGFQGLAW
jgi:hypothetical protein